MEKLVKPNDNTDILSIDVAKNIDATFKSVISYQFLIRRRLNNSFRLIFDRGLKKKKILFYI